MPDVEDIKYRIAKFHGVVCVQETEMKEKLWTVSSGSEVCVPTLVSSHIALIHSPISLSLTWH